MTRQKIKVVCLVLLTLCLHKNTYIPQSESELIKYRARKKNGISYLKTGYGGIKQEDANTIDKIGAERKAEQKWALKNEK